MDATAIATLERLLAKDGETALLRFGLAAAYSKSGDIDRAVEHAARAVELDPKYSAAWKLYGSYLAQLDRATEAADVYLKGIEVAEEQGDIQAAKEMRVFLRRLQAQ